MNTDSILATLWSLVNSPAVITAIGAAFLWLLNKVYAAKPAWKAYEGAIISGIKFAEKSIPDDASNKSLARLDAALKYVLDIYKQTEGKEASEAVKAELLNAIPVIHASLEDGPSL